MKLRTLVLSLCLLVVCGAAWGQSDLTVNLVSAYELTSDANDSTANALNLMPYGTFSFGANGVSLPDVFNGGLQRVTGFPDFSTDNFFAIFQVVPDFDAANQGYILTSESTDGSISQWDIGLGGDGSANVWITSPDTSPSTDGGLLTTGVRSTIAFWADKTNGVYGLQVDNDTVYTTPLVSGLWSLNPVVTVGNVAPLNYGTAGTIRYLYIYSGSNAVKSQADRTWLYNSGNGRTYVEIVGTHTLPSVKHGKGHRTK